MLNTPKPRTEFRRLESRLALFHSVGSEVFFRWERRVGIGLAPALREATRRPADSARRRVEE